MNEKKNEKNLNRNPKKNSAEKESKKLKASSFRSESGSGWEKMRSLANKISEKSDQVNEVVQALQYLTMATKDKGMLSSIFSTFAKLNKNHSARVRNSSSSAHTSESKAASNTQSNSQNSDQRNNFSSGGIDDFYGWLGSTAMQNIVKEVMNKRRRRRK